VNFTSAYAITKLGVALLVGVYGSNERMNVIIDVDFSCPHRSNGYFRGGSRNVEGGVLILCRAVGSNFVLGLALRKAVYRGVEG